jgi:hypothetical protein
VVTYAHQLIPAVEAEPDPAWRLGVEGRPACNQIARCRGGAYIGEAILQVFCGTCWKLLPRVYVGLADTPQPNRPECEFHTLPGPL